MMQLVILQFLILFSGFSSKIESLPTYEVLVELHPEFTKEDLLPNDNLLYIKELSKVSNIHLFGIIPERNDFQIVLDNLNRHPAVKAFEPNQKLEFRATPNDPNFSTQWTLERIALPDLWDQNTGGVTANGDTIVVAIVDSGFDVDHVDLSENIWRNSGEIQGDGIDNDNNGFIDDVIGWNFEMDRAAHKLDNHGTSVAGIAGAKGNNGIGVTGSNWNIKLMLHTVATSADIVSAYEYVLDQRNKYNQTNSREGAFVVAVNSSLGLQSSFFCSDFPVWGGMFDKLGAVGILTAAGTANSNINVDKVGDMPTSCPSDFLITLLNTNEEDEKHNSSAFGPISIDLGVPGNNSFTTKIRDGYGSFGDNSAAAPHLTGSIALLYTVDCPNFAAEALSNPQNTARQIKQAILEGVDFRSNLRGQTVTEGRLNTGRSYQLLTQKCQGFSPNEEILQIAPNPAKDFVNINVNVISTDPLYIQVIDVLGRVVFSNKIDNLTTESFQTSIPVSNLNKGVFYVSLRFGSGKPISKKVLIY